MAKILKSKYNSTGERSVDACLNYGELRFTNEDGSPVLIEIPCDKYDEAISDFDDRVKEGITHKVFEAKEILKRGSITYNQAKIIAKEGKIKGLDFFEIDGSIECDHILGVSGSIEYALGIWNGETKDEALLKSIIRATKVFGEEFVKALNLDDSVDESVYLRFAQNIHSIESISDIELYEVKRLKIDNDIHDDEEGRKQKFFNGINFPIAIIGGLLSFILVQFATNYGHKMHSQSMYYVLSFLAFISGGIIPMQISKFIASKYVKTNTRGIMEMFNEELEKVSYENLLTEKEARLILKNITKGEVSKLLLEMKGSVNKKISSNTIVNKESKFLLDARRMVVLPSEFDIKIGFSRLVDYYKDKLANDYNVQKI